MPGLKQLEKFSNDIKDVGDEVNIRAKRGEKPAVIPLPEGISDEDDSKDFILGLPVSEDDAASLSDVEDSLEELSDEDQPAPSFDSILNPQISSSDDDIDLSDFLDDVPAASEPESPEPEEIPLEDLDLESLLKPSGDDFPENEQEDAADLSSEEDLPIIEDVHSVDDIPGTGDIPGDNIPDSDTLNTDIPADDISDSDIADADIPSDDILSAEIPDGDILNTDTPTDDISDSDIPDSGVQPDDILSDDVLDDGIKDDAVQGGDIQSGENDSDNESDSSENIFGDLSDLPDFNEDFGSDDNDFGFSGQAIDMNEDLPEEISESAPKNTADISDNKPDTESFSSDTSDDNIFSGGDFELPDFDNLEDSDDAEKSVPESESSTDAEPAEDTDELVSDSKAGQSSGQASVSYDDLSRIFDTSDLDTSAPDASQDVPDDNIDISALENIDLSEEENSKPAEEFAETVVPSEDDFLLNDDNFEIPGFSDTDIAENNKKKSSIAADSAAFSADSASIPQRTSLTDEEYRLFRKNLYSYPLNVRIIIEDLIVKNEFTDSAVFEIIDKILKKASARQIASHLEKMLDIHIDVPRDYERRSVSQYEAYKSSFQYQLKNRIIPAVAAGILVFLAGWILFQSAVMFIYKPVMAGIIYRQGYTLLEENEYPQSESKFQEALEYKAIKKWFFKYAGGYREHRQYIRAADMYKNILSVFNHDKNAGLEYAEMELYDLADYELAEQIVRRDVLDYYINDADGILLLGDVFLEWGDTDSSKYESAREQYASLIQLYGQTDLYMSRMMRYFIRTDSLRNVLELKSRFYPDKKSLIPADWTELSGYLLDKLYGPLSRSDAYLRSSIEDVGSMLNIAVSADSENPVSHYNIARYFVENGNSEAAKSQMTEAIELFASQNVRTRKNTYREINANRILGELYAADREYLKAQEIYTAGINLFQNENKLTGLEGDSNTGKLYADLGDIDYFISGDLDAALVNYEMSVKTKNDTASLNYRIGAIRYGKNDYDKSLTAFIKAAESESSDKNLLLALGNVLALKNDNFAAQGYYSQLLANLDVERSRHSLLSPQEREEDYNLVDMYLRVNNNLGVTLYKIARQTGDSAKNAESLVRLSDSIRAWDSLTRNQQTMVRMEGSNLAAQNSKYITHPAPGFEPAIYTDIPRTLSNEKVLN